MKKLLILFLLFTSISCNVKQEVYKVHFLESDSVVYINRIPNVEVFQEDVIIYRIENKKEIKMLEYIE